MTTSHFGRVDAITDNYYREHNKAMPSVIGFNRDYRITEKTNIDHRGLVLSTIICGYENQ